MAVARVQLKNNQKDSGNAGLWKTGPEEDQQPQPGTKQVTKIKEQKTKTETQSNQSRQERKQQSI